MFQGFTEASGQLFWELVLHNERPWFMEHKDEFEQQVIAPLQALAEETLSELRRRFPQRDWRLHVSRIYRDARRLHGRGPYKEQLWFTLREGADDEETPVFWFELNPSHYRYGVGGWATPRQMEHWRAYVAANRAAVERLARRLARQSDFALGGEAYKRPRAELGELLNPWVNCKELDIGCRHDFGGALLRADFPQTLAEEYAALMPYYKLFTHLFN